MKEKIFKTICIAIVFILISCSEKTIGFNRSNLEIVNRDLISVETNTLKLDHRKGDRLVILKNVNFDIGTIEIELKGENIPYNT
ncbi:hypothetical protein [Zunongwangia pacifica]|uniref:Uncharacterized protein n=1 Tax=Zunongwangia pacifica TaxID=2911062 RepID=A0A9X2CNH4_9FLAO|nr:hypothetical protein [Zunongwangia pacifica]MCL6220545.1 hypothetical protein [Zunongwangia pacifica]